MQRPEALAWPSVQPQAVVLDDVDQLRTTQLRAAGFVVYPVSNFYVEDGNLIEGLSLIHI